MCITSCKPCCKQTAIKAFEQRIFYLVGCEFCGTVFSLTNDFQFLFEQIMAYYKIRSTHHYTFDFILHNGNAIFILP
jgi:hypothetical protein